MLENHISMVPFPLYAGSIFQLNHYKTRHIKTYMSQYGDFYVQPMFDALWVWSSNAQLINLRLCPKESHDIEKTFSKPNSNNHSTCLGELFRLFHEIPS